MATIFKLKDRYMSDTIANAFFQDQRVLEAKKLIAEALKEHTSKITTIKTASEDLKTAYADLLDSFSGKRGGNLFYKYIGSGIGNGALVELADGSVKYDFITGIGVHYFGHSHAGVLAAQVDGAITNTTMSGNLQQNVDMFKLT